MYEIKVTLCIRMNLLVLKRYKDSPSIGIPVLWPVKGKIWMKIIRNRDEKGLPNWLWFLCIRLGSILVLLEVKPTPVAYTKLAAFKEKKDVLIFLEGLWWERKNKVESQIVKKGERELKEKKKKFLVRCLCLSVSFFMCVCLCALCFFFFPFLFFFFFPFSKNSFFHFFSVISIFPLKANVIFHF